MALATAVGGAAFGRTRSLAISQRGHGHHLLQQNLKEVRQLRARAQDLAGEASCVRSLWLGSTGWAGWTGWHLA